MKGKWEPLPEPFSNDFRYFLVVVWKHLQLPKPTPIQLDIAEYMQDGPKRRIIEAFRGVGKSWMAAAYVLWLLRNDPQKKIMVVSASKTRADDFAQFCLRLIREMNILKCLDPDRDEQRSASNRFDVRPSIPDQSPSVKSVGIFGQLTGSRADLILADDVEVPNTAWTVGMREKLLHSVGEFNAILKPGGEIMFLGTPQTEESIYNKLRTKSYQCRIWPSRYPKNPDKYGDALAPVILDRCVDRKNMPTDPDRFSEMDLVEREASYGRSQFTLQFQLDTTLSDLQRFPLRLSDLIVMEVDQNAPEKLVWSSGAEYRINDLPTVGFSGDYYHRPAFIHGDWIEFQGCVMFVDPSGRGMDETAYAIVAQLNGNLFVLEVGAFREGYTEPVLEGLAQAAKRQKVKLILLEDQFGQGMLQSLLQPYLRNIYPCTIEPVRSNMQKERRIINALEPVLNQHRLIINRSVVEKDSQPRDDDPIETALAYQLFHQMTHLTVDKNCLQHDDRLDALAGAIEYWNESLAIDENRAIKEREAELWDLELAAHKGDIEGALDAKVLGIPLASLPQSRGKEIWMPDREKVGR
tara:strand:+ start:10952 stop:12688 length:1737 start_codon:yes stop_codon:yes gene_type:complete